MRYLATLLILLMPVICFADIKITGESRGGVNFYTEKRLPDLRVVIEADSQPKTRADGSELQEGDKLIIVDTRDSFVWTDGAWVENLNYQPALLKRVDSKITAATTAK